MEIPGPAADLTRPTVSLGEPGEIAVALPYLLGYRPAESIVLVSLGGPSGRRVGLTVRADLPPPEHGPALARALTRSLAQDRPDGVLLVVLSEAPEVPDGLPHRGLVHDLVLALDAVGLPLREALLVARERWWSYDCPYPCCEPGAGTPLPADVGELAAASVAVGTVVARDRQELALRIAPPPEPARTSAGDACLRAGGERAAEVEARGWAAVRAGDRSAIGSAVRRFRPGPSSEPWPDDELAEVLWALRDVQVRDWALQLALGEERVAAESLWTECTRRAPSPLDAAPATLLAVCAWLRGDGAMANIALDRALDGDPGYSLARLLAQALAACVPPAELRELLTLAADDADRPAG